MRLSNLVSPPPKQMLAWLMGSDLGLEEPARRSPLSATQFSVNKWAQITWLPHCQGGDRAEGAAAPPSISSPKYRAHSRLCTLSGAALATVGAVPCGSGPPTSAS